MTQPPHYQQPYPAPGLYPQHSAPYPQQQAPQPTHQQAPQYQQLPYQQPYQQPYQPPYQQQYGQQYPQPEYQTAPQRGYAPYPAQPQYPAQQQAAYRTPGTTCRICGSAPAAQATFRAVVGAVFMHTMWTSPGPYCRDCGLHIFRRQTTKTLTGGWCSLGAIVLTPVFLLMNISARDKVANLPAPQPCQDSRGQAPLDPGPPLFHRPGAYVYPALAGLLLLLIIIGDLTS